MKDKLKQILFLFLTFLGLTLLIPTLFKHHPFVMLPFLGILAILLMRQSLFAPQEPPA